MLWNHAAILTNTLLWVWLEEQSVDASEWVVSLTVEEVYCGAQHLHLPSHCRYLVTITREEHTNTTQLLGAMADVPDLVIKMPAGKQLVKKESLYTVQAINNSYSQHKWTFVTQCFHNTQH